MKFIAVLALSAAAIASGAAMAREPAKGMTDAQFANSFQCPESLPTDEARKAEMKRFVDWGTVRHPDWDVQRLIAYRVSLLEANGCEQSLRSIREASK